MFNRFLIGLSLLLALASPVTAQIIVISRPGGVVGGGGAGNPGGTDTQVQYNDGGVFGGDPGFVFNETTNVVTATGGFVGPVTGNASTATALANDGANCSAGQFPLGVDVVGAVQSCTALPTTITGTANQIAASAATGAITLSIPTNPTLPGTTTGAFSGTFAGTLSGTIHGAGAAANTGNAVIENLTATDDDMFLASIGRAVTITSVWCNYKGSAPTTLPTLALKDGAGNTMTHTAPTCAAQGTVATAQSITSGGGLTAREILLFSVTNTPDPDATQTYLIGFTFEVTD